jgi:capsular exopolysaccharide synthesis family protein
MNPPTKITIPTDQPQKAFGLDKRLVALYRPACWETDRYRMLRGAVERLRGEKAPRVIGVTSSTPGEGKSTTSVNLAAVLAETPGTRVLLVDCDFRCSAVARLLGITGFTGPDMREAIENPVLGLDDLTVNVPGTFPFAVAPSRPWPLTAHQLVESPRLGDLLAEARREYDYVVVDAPPVVPVADCRTISRHVDGFVFIVAANKTSRKMLGQALNLFGPDELLGLVFNFDEEPIWASAGRYYYRYGTPP